MLSFSGDPGFAEYNNPDTDWMRDGKYGIHIKYLNAIPRGGTTIAEFNQWVNAFDVDAFGEAVEQTGASWVIWPLGRTWFNSPNATLESFVGDFTSDRDLPLEIYDVLHERGIRLMLYAACDKAKTDEDRAGKVALGWNGDNNNYTSTFVDNWSDVLKVWSDRYGKKISGWWLDHCRPNYASSNTACGTSNPELATYRTHLFSGNPDDGILGINHGQRATGDYPCHSPEDDYRAGHPSKKSQQVAPSRWWNGLQWHYMFSLSRDWTSPTGWGLAGVGTDTQELIDYVIENNRNEGVNTLSVFVYKTPGESAEGVIKVPGNLSNAQLRQLAALRDASLGFVDNTSSDISFNGTWAKQDDGMDFHGSTSWTDEADNHAELAFSGTGVEVAVRKGSNGGLVDVVLDGAVVVDDFDTYSSTTAYRQVIYENQNLSSGSHTIRLVATGQKNASATEADAMLDYFAVTWLDTTAPRVLSITSDATHPTKDPFTVTIDFLEDVTGLTAGEIAVNNGSGSNLAGTGSSYTLDIEPIANFEGDVTVRVPVGAAVDGANNGNIEGSETFAVDTTAPRVLSITSDATHPTKDPFTVTIDFLEDVTGLTAGEIAVNNGSGSNLAGTGSSYTLDIEPIANFEGDVTVRVPVGAAVDGANNGNIEGSETFAVDTTAPRVLSITSDATHPTKDPFTVTIDFLEDVTGLTAGEIAVNNGSGSNLAGTGSSYTLDIEPIANFEGDVTVRVPVGAAVDGANNGNIEGSETFAVDTTAPAFQSAAVDGSSLTLTYGEALDPGSRPAPGDFTVEVDGSGRSVSGASVSGSVVTLTLNLAVEHGETGIQVSYTPEMNPIRDAVGNEAQGLSREPVTNDTPDTTSPEVSSVAISSNPGSDQTYAAGDEIEVTVTFSETVEVEGTPQLRLRVGSRNRTAGYLRGTGTAALVFGYEVADGESDTDGVGVEADSLSGGTIRDVAGNDAVLDHEAVAPQAGHKVDGVRPAFGSAAVDGSSLTLTYGEALDGSSTPVPGDFTVQVDGNGRTVAGVLVSGSTVTLTLDPAVEHGETGIRVSYTPGMKPIRDVPGNEAEALSRESVRNDTPDTTSPEVSSVAISSNPGSDRTYAAEDEIEVMVAFSETVEVTGTPQLRLELGGGTRTATYEGGTGTAALVFAYEVADGESDTDGVGVEEDSLSGGTIRDEARNNAELDHEGLAADSGHKVDGVKPELAASGGAVANGTTLTLTYEEPLDRSSTPDTGDFTVTGGDQARTVTGVSVSGSAVMLTLSAGAEHGEAGIQVSYTPGMKPLRDVPGNEAQSLSREAVTNDTPDTTPPQVSSVAISSNPGSDQTYAAGDEIEVTVIFSETVEVEGTPQLRLELGGGTRTATYEGGTGTAVLVFGYEVAEGESDTDGVGVEEDSLSGGTIRDEARNSAKLDHEGLAADSGHKVDGVKPELAASGGAVVNGTTLTLTYEEPLDRSSTPDTGDFTVTGGDQARTVTGVSVSGSAVMLTLSAGAEHEEAGIQVSYTPGMKPLRDVPGNEAQSLSRESVRNDTPDTTSPEVSSVAISSNPGSDRTYAAEDEIEVMVAFSETVEVTGTPQLRLELGGGTRTATYEGGTGTAALVFAYEVADGESDTDGVGVEEDSLSGGTIRDEARNSAKLDHEGLAADSGHKVDGVKPELAASGGAVANGTTLTLTYDEPLDRSSTPDTGDFTVTGGDQARTVTGVSVSGSAVMLTLSAGAEHEEAGIQVSYTPGMKPLRDVPGNEAQSLSREAVTNDTPDTTPPQVSSLAISSNPGGDQTYAAGDEIEVTVTFSETVEVDRDAAVEAESRDQEPNGQLPERHGHGGTGVRLRGGRGGRRHRRGEHGGEQPDAERGDNSGRRGQ